MSARGLLIYWLIWNFYWSIPYSYSWQLFSGQNKTVAVNLSGLIYLLILQIILPFMVFEYLFDIENYSSAMWIGGFATICIPAGVCNSLIPKISSIQFAVTYLYAMAAVLVIVGGVHVWFIYVDSIILNPVQRVCILVILTVFIPVVSWLHIPFFLNHGTIQRRR